MMSWHYVSSAEYAAGVKVEGDMYFLSDTREIYRGNTPFTESVILYSELPTSSIAVNRLYINSNTLEGRIYNGNSWTVVIKPVDSTVTANSNNPVSSKAVVSYVTDQLLTLAKSENVVKSVDWDETDHVLTVTRGDNSTQTVVLDGLGIDLSYNPSTGKLQLLDASGNAIGSTVSLDLERFVTSGEYKADTKSIILYFDAEKTEYVTIPVGELVDTYTAESSSTLTLSVENNVIKGSVKVSNAQGNAIQVDPDKGLYVPTVDTSDKIDKVTDATPDNVAIFDSNGNVVDSGKTLDEIIPNNHVYTGSTLNEAVNGVTPVKSDVAVVRKQIGTTDKYERTAYIYNGSAWEALDESYSAENVYFSSDLITTSAVGNVVLTNGQATISAAGKNLKQVWDSIFVKEQNPTITQPYVTMTASQCKAYEVGTTVSPSYTATLNPGLYEFNDNGGATGVTASSWTVTDTDGHSLSTNSGTFDSIVVDDGENYKITATATYNNSPIIPVTNLGNEYTDGQIKAGSKSATSNSITGYRNGFYGTLTTKNELTSDAIRGLSGKTNKLPTAGNVINITVPVGAMRVVLAYPATIRDVSSITDSNGLNAEIKTAFSLTQMDVEGANNYTAIAYKVYVMDFAIANDVANTYKVTL